MTTSTYITSRDTLLGETIVQQYQLMRQRSLYPHAPDERLLHLGR